MAPKLYYFDIPGKGEAIRLASVYGNYELEDIRISREEFTAMKAAGKLPFGQVPALEIEDGVFLSQSAAIMRYIGKKTGLYPSDDVAAALVDAVIDEEIDLFAGLAVSAYKERFGFGFLNDDKALLLSVREKLNVEVIPRHLGFLENILSKSSTGWIANTAEPTIADFILVPRLKWLTSGVLEGISTDILTPFPCLSGLINKLMSLPAITAYYDAKQR